MAKIYNLVFAKHENQNKNFLFQLPVNVEIKVNQRIFVDTMYGETEAIAVTSNFHVDVVVLSAIVEGCGAYLPLKNVTGYAEKVEKYQKISLTDCLPYY